MTASTFKERYYNHKKSFTNAKYDNETELSKHVWKLKRSNKQYTISSSIVKRAPAFVPGMRRCMALNQGETMYNAKRQKKFAKQEVGNLRELPPSRKVLSWEI